MAGFGAYAGTMMLNWLNCTATVTQPTSWFMGICTGNPNSTAASEITGDATYARVTASFKTATGGIQINSVALGLWKASPSKTASGWAVFDTSVTGTGNMLMYGTFSALSSFTSSGMSVAASSMSISLK